MNREHGSGQYTYSNLDRMCICGHTLGKHNAERTKHDGKVFQPCFNGDDGEPCDCLRFTPIKSTKTP